MFSHAVNATRLCAQRRRMRSLMGHNWKIREKLASSDPLHLARTYFVTNLGLAYRTFSGGGGQVQRRGPSGTKGLPASNQQLNAKLLEQPARGTTFVRQDL